MDNVIKLVQKDEKISSKELLQQAIDAGITGVTIIGYDKGEYEFWSSVEDDPAEIIWLLERTKLNILRSVEE